MGERAAASSRPRYNERMPSRAVAAVLLLALCASGCAEELDAGPSVILVTVDTLRADHVGCYGAVGAETPTLDSFAADGVRFATAARPLASLITFFTKISEPITSPSTQ